MLLAQLLLALLLRRHQRAILRILRLQRGYQPGLLCERLLLFCGLLVRQLNRCDNSEL